MSSMETTQLGMEGPEEVREMELPELRALSCWIGSAQLSSYASFMLSSGRASQTA